MACTFLFVSLKQEDENRYKKSVECDCACRDRPIPQGFASHRSKVKEMDDFRECAMSLKLRNSIKSAVIKHRGPTLLHIEGIFAFVVSASSHHRTEKIVSFLNV